MTTLADYFRAEAGDYLARMEALLGEKPAGAAGLRGLARGLRGTAQLARQEAAFRAAGALEAAARAAESGDAAWDDEAIERARESVNDLRRLLDAEDDETRTAIADAVVARWQGTGPSPPEVAEPQRGEQAFVEFAIGELKTIVAAVEAAIEAFAENPDDRRPLHDVLTAQAALLGSSRLDALPIVGESLRALDDLARLVLRLDVPVKREWVEVFRTARDVLGPAAAALERGEEPVASPPLSRLRTLRAELSDRYRPREAAAAEGAAADEPLVDINDLCFDAQSARRRAAELRPALERAVAHDPSAREALDELFDLIRLALE